MEQALSFFRTLELWIYLLLGLGGLYFVRRFYLAWQELQEAAFGLERENAQARLNQAASVIVLLLGMAVTEFVLVSFVAPTVPGATPLLTPTLNLLATPGETLVAAPPVTPPAGATLPVDGTVTAGGPTAAPGCVPGQIEILAPAGGGEVSGIVPVNGTASLPNFGFYKLELRLPDDPTWATLLAGNEARVDGLLGNWDTRRLSPGEYQLGLVVVDNEARSSEPCVVQVRVVPDAQETPIP